MLAALKSEFPNMQITVLTAFREFDYAQHAIRLGVCRYLLKPSRMDELHEAVAAMTANLSAEGASVTSLSDDSDEEAGSFVAHAAMKYMEQHCTEHPDPERRSGSCVRKPVAPVQAD